MGSAWESLSFQQENNNSFFIFSCQQTGLHCEYFTDKGSSGPAISRHSALVPAENLPSWSSTALGHRGPRRREGRAPRYPAQEDSQGAERRPPKPFCFASVIYVRQPRPFSSRFMAVCPGRDINYGIYGNLNLSKIEEKTPRLAVPSPGVLRAIRVDWLGC